MRLRDSFNSRLPPQLRQLHPDLVVVAILTVLTVGVVFLPFVRDTPFRFVLAIPFVLFLPGYALVSVLFPERTTLDDSDRGEAESDGIFLTTIYEKTGIDGVERAVFAFGTSILIAPLFGIALNFTPWGIRLAPLTLSIAGFTLLMTAVASHRRWVLPEKDQYSVPYGMWISSVRGKVSGPQSQFDAILSVVLAFSILLAIGSVTYAVAAPPNGEEFSELYLLTENDSGELVTDNYPQQFVVDEPRSLVVGVKNHEGEPTEYTLVVEIHDVTALEGDRVRIDSRERVEIFNTTLDNGDTWQTEHEIMSTKPGDDLRVTYLLYLGEPPAEPTKNNAYRSSHFWVNVGDSDSVDENETI